MIGGGWVVEKKLRVLTLVGEVHVEVGRGSLAAVLLSPGRPAYHHIQRRDININGRIRLVRLLAIRHFPLMGKTVAYPVVALEELCPVCFCLSSSAKACAALHRYVHTRV